MSKLLTMLGAFTLAYSIGGIAAEADNTNTNQQSQQPQTQQVPEVPATLEQRELEYFAAVTKCERIANEDKKQKCFDAARSKHGQM